LILLLSVLFDQLDSFLDFIGIGFLDKPGTDGTYPIF
jgi:hypothetical protein